MIKLSKKEKIIADLLCTGLMQKEIAKKLKIKESTVASYRSSILKKTGKSTIKELMSDMITELKAKIELLEKEVQLLVPYKLKWEELRSRYLPKRGK